MPFFGRGLNKIQTPINIGDMYDEYKASVEPNSPYDVKRSEYMAILDEYFKLVSEGLLAGKRSFKIPMNLGFIVINKRKVDLSNLRRVDWKATNESGTKVYHLNEHSDGYDYKVDWNRPIHTTRNSRMYNFNPTRKIKRTLAKLIKSKEFDTYEL